MKIINQEQSYIYIFVIFLIFPTCLTSQYYYKATDGSILHSPAGICQGPWYYDHKDSKGRTIVSFGYSNESDAMIAKAREREQRISLNKFWHWEPGDDGFFPDEYSEVYCNPSKNLKNNTLQDALALVNDLAIKLAKEIQLVKQNKNIANMKSIGSVFLSYSNACKLAFDKAEGLRTKLMLMNEDKYQEMKSQYESILTDLFGDIQKMEISKSKFTMQINSYDSKTIQQDTLEVKQKVETVSKDSYDDIMKNATPYWKNLFKRTKDKLLETISNVELEQLPLGMGYEIYSKHFSQISPLFVKQSDNIYDAISYHDLLGKILNEVQGDPQYNNIKSLKGHHNINLQSYNNQEDISRWYELAIPYEDWGEMWLEYLSGTQSKGLCIRYNSFNKELKISINVKSKARVVGSYSSGIYNAFIISNGKIIELSGIGKYKDIATTSEDNDSPVLEVEIPNVSIEENVKKAILCMLLTTNNGRYDCFWEVFEIP